MAAERNHLVLRSFNIGSILLLGWYVAAFLTKEATSVSWTFSNLYLILLSYYAGDKEIDRWKKRYRPRHRRGERFVLAWAGTGVAMLLIEIIGGAEHGYRVPETFAFTAASVMVIYFVTAYLKSEAKRR